MTVIYCHGHVTTVRSVGIDRWVCARCGKPVRIVPTAAVVCVGDEDAA